METNIESNNVIHESVLIGKNVKMGSGIKIWSNSTIREDSQIGSGTSIGIGVYVGSNVKIGENCKIQNYAQIYEGSEISDGVFIGPLVVITNDKKPRALNSQGKIKTRSDWQQERIFVAEGASLGAGSILVAPLKIGQNALVGAGSIVTRDVPDYAVVVGNPARIHGWVCKHGENLKRISDTKFECVHSGELIIINK